MKLLRDRLRTAARRSHHHGDDAGLALPTVLISMAVLTLFALTALALVVDAAPGSRRTADAKAAVAAAQAGIDEYATRLNANPTYYALNGTGIDADNRAFTKQANGSAFTDGRDPRGVPVPGTAGAGGWFRYEVLTTPVETARRGSIRVRVTGTAANGQSRPLTATFGQDGYLRFLYFTDVEALDPALGPAVGTTTRDGSRRDYDLAQRSFVTYEPDPAIFADVCSRHWYAEGGVPGRSAGGSYRSSATRPYVVVKEGTNPPDEQRRTDARDVRFSCTEIQFGGNDVITGPLHTNDAMTIGGPVTFIDDQTETSWADTDSPAPSDPTRRWRPTSTYAGRPSGTQPHYAAQQSIPRSNAKLRAQAEVDGEGCLYTGETSIRFDGTAMFVRSPQTTTTTSPECLNTANRAAEQRISPIPPVVYVRDSTSACTPSLGYPAAGEAIGGTGTTTAYSCRSGNAYVSGRLQGQATVATENDVVITGDLTYAGGTGGDDVLGLIPNNYAWVYHPVRSNGSELLPASARVRRVDAAILSLNRSFLVQNWSLGATDSPTLTVNGVIAQKFRGPVGTGSGTGYTKNYVYDERLRFLPPPYFLTPVDSPWTLQRTTDG